LRERLGVGSGAPLGYRHVELTCGGRVLSVAQNWFVRERLTAQMNAVLDRSDVPFGKVVAPLHFTRETVEERRGAAPGCPRGTALSHLAMLRLPGGAPVAYLTECYTRAAVR
jgi:chorismate-pyruvate lyase